MTDQNLIIIMSDEHNRDFAGCYGHKIATTPNIDRLAKNGTLFRSAYTPSPICVPARAAFATGKYVHQIGFWDNAMAYDGRVPSWHHLLRDKGHQVVSIGKLHFRSGDDDYGFSDEQVAMHVIEGKGDLLGLVRDEDMPKRGGSWKMAKMAGPGESVYTIYDREIAARAQIWLREEAPKYQDKPWVLFVSFVCPHFPLTAPPEHFYRYYNMDLPAPKLYAERHAPAHPYIEDYRKSLAYDDFFETPDMVKRAQAGYLGLCSFLDENIGKVMAVVEETGLAAGTRIVYTSDHGDNVGARGLWGKSTMYEEAVAVPLVIAGPDVPKGVSNDTPVSLLDLYPFIMDTVGEGSPEGATGLPGKSVLALAAGEDPGRVVFSEYHAMGSKTAAYMVRKGHHKLVYYVGYPSQLFDLKNDPQELVDLSGEQAAQPILEDLMRELYRICDPEEVDRIAKADQDVLLQASGGKPAVIARGDLGFSVPPGVAPHFD